MISLQMENRISICNQTEKIDRREAIRRIALYSTAALLFSACNNDTSYDQDYLTSKEAMRELEILYDYGSISPEILQEEILTQIGLTGGLKDEDKWFGFENLQFLKNQKNQQYILRVKYPAGSASQHVTDTYGAPIGGTQFNVGIPQDLVGRERLNLSYSLRFARNFKFVKGGKLPGFYGGSVYSGQRPPDGTNGFSTRYMWNRDGEGSAYVYSPEIESHDYDHGIHYGLGNWRFIPGEWIGMRQQVRLNTPGDDDGRIQVWVNGEDVLNQQGMRYRDVPDLEFDGVYFSTFFGGSDQSWETPVDTYIDFSNFQIDDSFREGEYAD